MFKFLHAADIHLDSPLRGLERYDGAPVDQIRQATRRALENLVQLAIEERVDFVLIAGDLYDGNWKDYNTGLYFISQMARLRQADIPVYLITGNHDAANRMTRALRLPDNVFLLPIDQPDTKVLESCGVAIHGQGFRIAAVTDDLSAGYPHARRGYFNIGLLHTCLTGCEGHDSYAPCTIEGLCSKGYEYWALGHIHHRRVIQENPHIIFPGNIQGRKILETGPKGCMLVTVGDGQRVEAKFHCLDVLRWELCAVDASGAEDPEAVLERLGERIVRLRHDSDGRPLAMRVEVRGACPAHESLLADPQRWTNEVRSRGIEVGGEEVWVEKVKFLTTPAGSAPSFDGPIEELLNLLELYRTDETRLLQLQDELADLERKLPPEMTEGPEGLHLGDPAWLRHLLDQVQPLLVSRLLAGGDGR